MPDTVAEVKKHNLAVQKPGPKRVCYRKLCDCHATAPFHPHNCRKRGLRVIVGGKVLCMPVWLASWRCRKCRRTFTDYPDFRTSL